MGCLSPHGQCVSEGTTSAQRINSHIDRQEAGDEDGAYSSMRMLAIVMLWCMFCVAAVGGYALWVFTR